MTVCRAGKGDFRRQLILLLSGAREAYVSSTAGAELVVVKETGMCFLSVRLG